MERFLFLLFVILLLALKDVNSKKNHKHTKSDDGKIVGGMLTRIEKYPYQVAVFPSDGQYTYRCGGSIISSRYILTAAHCLTNMTTVTVRAGSTFVSFGGQKYTSTNFSQHPLYDAEGQDYDVGVVVLDDDIDTSSDKSKTVELASNGTTPEDDTDIVVTGWGAVFENGFTSPILMEVTVPKTSTEYCMDAYGPTITSRMFCAGLPSGGKDSCQGDSGGPAVDVSSKIQVGIVSFGYGCARKGKPGVYTNVGNPEIREYISSMTGV